MAGQPERRDTYWKRCSGCSGTGKIKRPTSHGVRDMDCGMCHGKGSVEAPVSR